MLAVKILTLLISAIIIVFFLIINTHSAEIHYYNLNFDFKTITLPLSVIVFSTSLFGFLAAIFLNSLDRFKLKRSIRKQNKRLKTLENELEEYRQMPKRFSHAKSQPSVQQENCLEALSNNN